MATRFTIDGVTYTLLESMTFAEARAIEKVTGGVTLPAIHRDPALRERTDVLQALTWVSMKRQNPTLRFSDLDDIDMSDIAYDRDEPDADEAGEDQPDPTQGGDEPTTPSTPSA